LDMYIALNHDQYVIHIFEKNIVTSYHEVYYKKLRETLLPYTPGSCGLCGCRLSA
jgi:hypothetical protein